MNCYECEFRGELMGSAHSRCNHPATRNKEESPLMEAMAILASVGRVGPTINTDAATELGIIANPTGVKRGWFNWPYTFDPVWLISCNGFKQKEVKK